MQSFTYPGFLRVNKSKFLQNRELFYLVLKILKYYSNHIISYKYPPHTASYTRDKIQMFKTYQLMVECDTAVNFMHLWARARLSDVPFSIVLLPVISRHLFDVNSQYPFNNMPWSCKCFWTYGTVLATMAYFSNALSTHQNGEKRP